MNSWWSERRELLLATIASETRRRRERERYPVFRGLKTFSIFQLAAARRSLAPPLLPPLTLTPTAETASRVLISFDLCQFLLHQENPRLCTIQWNIFRFNYLEAFIYNFILSRIHYVSSSVFMSRRAPSSRDAACFCHCSADFWGVQSSVESLFESENVTFFLDALCACSFPFSTLLELLSCLLFSRGIHGNEIICEFIREAFSLFGARGERWGKVGDEFVRLLLDCAAPVVDHGLVKTSNSEHVNFSFSRVFRLMSWQFV